MKYMIWDLETQNKSKYKRFSSPFIKENWVVARGWKVQGDKQNSWSYHKYPDGKFTHIPKDVVLLVGHNIKFDLLYEWNSPEMQAFFKRGGKIWDTQYAEYLIQGQRQDYQMVAMDQIAEAYGGRTKIDSVKALWNAGVMTSDIDKDMLIDYLVGTEEEKRSSGDIGNTELIFLGQIEKARKQKMLTMIQARMDGLLATTEMEWNGLKIDVQEAERRMNILNDELVVVSKELEEYIPELPEGLEFNWSSNYHKSYLIFGGLCKYKKSAPYRDENGKWVRYKAVADWPLFDGKPIDPQLCRFKNDLWTYKGKTQDRFLSGKRKGEGKTKKVPVKGKRKFKIQEFTFRFPGYVSPKMEWAGSLEDAEGQPIYATNEDVIEELGSYGVPFLVSLLKHQTIMKDLGTYYARYDPKKKVWVGLLTCVMPETHMVHHKLNHTSTVTTRLSSSDPNLQNIPRGDTSEVKKMFISRFGDEGIMMEADYSQLEVVGQGVLSGDKNLLRDLRNKIDFHCKRVAAKFGCSYEEALYWCKDAAAPDHKLWKSRRTGVKEFSFQRAYGAGAAAIALSTGMPIDDVKELMELEDEAYPGVTEFNNSVEEKVKASAKAFRDPSRGMKVYRRGWYRSPTGTKYTFRSYDAPDFLQERGVKESFKPTEMKNYPVQGFCGEIVQIIIGRLWRHFVANNNYGGLAFLCNTVHDCVWIDCHKSVMDEVARDIQRIMESVPEVLGELYNMKVDVPFPVEVEVGPNLYDKTVIHIEENNGKKRKDKK